MTAVTLTNTSVTAGFAGKEPLQVEGPASWQVFAATGDILFYLDYKQAQRSENTPAGDTEHGNPCDTGSGAERDPL